MRKLITETYGLICILAELCKVVVELIVVAGSIVAALFLGAYLIKQIL